MKNGRKDYTGFLKAYDKETITIEDDEEEMVFLRSEVALVRLSFDF